MRNFETHADDRLSYMDYRQTLTAHQDAVCTAMGDVLDGLEDPSLGPYHPALYCAAREHD